MLAASRPLSRPLVLLSDRLLPAVVDEFRGDLDLQTLQLPSLQLSSPQLPNPQHGPMDRAEGLVVLLTVPVDHALLEKLPRLKVVGNYAVGVDNVNLSACEERGVRVVNTPDVLTRSTAELALALTLAAARRFVEAEGLARSGRWRGWAPDQLLGMQLEGKRALIVGPGRIGQATATLFRAVGLDVVTLSSGAAEPEIQAALAAADVVSLHLPLRPPSSDRPSTRHWLSRSRLASLKDGAIVINTARGPIIDEQALIEELQSGRLRAGLDVYEEEPQLPASLRSCENVVLLPHVGSATDEARAGMVRSVLSGVRSVLAGEEPPNLLV